MASTRRRDRLDVPVSVQEKRAAHEMAARRGVSMSALVRALLGKALKEEREREDALLVTYPHGRA